MKITRKLIGLIFLVVLLGFLGWVFLAGYNEKRTALVSDLIPGNQNTIISAVVTSRLPTSISSVVVGKLDARGLSAFESLPPDAKAQVAEFDVTNTLVSRGMPDVVAQEYGKFSFPSEFRSWNQKVAGFNARVELYTNVKAGHFVALVWNGQ